MTTDDARIPSKAVEPPVRSDSRLASTITKDKTSISRQSSKSRSKSGSKKKSRSKSASSKKVEGKQPPSPKFPVNVDVSVAGVAVVVPEEKPATEIVLEGPPASVLAATTPASDTAVASAVTGDAQNNGAPSKDPAGNVRFGEVKVSNYDIPPVRSYAGAGVAVGFGSAIVGFMLLVLGFALSRKPVEVMAEPGFCESDQCREALHYLEISGDMTEDPCRDFYQYVCFRWMENGSFMGDVMAEFYTLEDSIISPGALPYVDEYGSRVFVHTYRSCFSFINATKDNAYLEDVLPRLLNHARSLHNLVQKDLVAAIARLSVVEGIDVLFGVGLQTYKNSTYPALWSGRSLRKKFEGLANFSGLIKEALLKITSGPLAEGLVEDIVRLDDAVNAAFENDSDTRLLNISAIADAAEGLKPPEVASLFEKHLHGLQAERFFWIGEIQTKTVLEIIKNARSKTAEVYLSLQVAADILALYYKSRSQEVLTQPEMVKTCLVAACRVASHACAHMVSRQIGLAPVSEGDVEALYEAVLDEFSHIDSHVSWIDKSRLTSLMKVFRNSTVTLLHRITKPLYHKATVVHPNQTVWSNNFLEEHLALMAVHKAASLAYPLDVEVAELAERQLKGSLDFSDYLRSMVVSGALLSVPLLYTATMPTEFNFGTIGALLAREVAHVITPASSRDWWTRPLIEAFQESTECLKGLYRKFERNASDWDIATSSNLFAWTVAAKTALNALLSGGGGIGALPPLEPGDQKQQEARKNAMRVFFRRFCLLACGRDEPGLSARSRCMLPLVGMRDFVTAFDCPAGSAMNPNDTCSLRLYSHHSWDNTSAPIAVAPDDSRVTRVPTYA